MKNEIDRIDPAVRLVAGDLRKAYDVLRESQTPQAKGAARKNVLGKLLAALIITQYTERVNPTKPRHAFNRI